MALDLNSSKLVSDDMNIYQVVLVIWQRKILVISIAFVFTILSVVYSLIVPEIYRSKIVLSPSQAESSGGMGAIGSQYGGLASLAGISLNSGSNRIEQAVEVMKNWPFIDSVVRKYQLKPLIMAVEKWDKDENQLIYSDIYNKDTGIWSIDDLESKEGPSSFKTFKAFKEMLNLSLDSSTGMLLLEVEHYSPHVSYQLANYLVKEINEYFRALDINEAKNNIQYLNKKINETAITDMQTVFYNLIESQTKSLMLAEVSEFYLFRPIVPAMVPDERVRPQRMLICVLGMIFGCIFGVLVALSMHFIRTFNFTSNFRKR